MQITISALKEAEKTLSKCEYLGETVKKYGHCELKGQSAEPFKALLSAIISQQLSVKAAATIEKRFFNLIGHEITAESVLAYNTEQLRSVGLSNRKAEYVLGIATAVKDQSLNFEMLAQASNQEVIDTLVKLRGVGKWTAEMFMIYALGRIDVFSALDLGLQRGINQLFGETDIAAMDKIAERWSPYRSVASWYLWRLAD